MNISQDTKGEQLVQQRTRYPSDLTDEKWALISSHLTRENLRGRNRSTDLREVVNGINYRWSTGCVWRMLPHDYPPWETVYFYFNRWKNDGTLSKIRQIMITRPSAEKSPSRFYNNFSA